MSASPNFTQYRDIEDGHPVYRQMEDAAAFHWRLDEGDGTEVTDEVQGEVGTINGATWTADSEWNGGYGLQFNAGDWIQFDIQSLGGGQEQMWVSVAFAHAEPNNRGILASVVDVDDADRWNFESGSWDNNGSIAWWMSGDTSAQSGADAIQANTKQHALGVHDNINDYREVLLDGQSRDIVDVGGAVPGGEPTTFKIGRRGAGSREFVGVIGEVMIGFTPLDEHDKQRLYERQPFSSAGSGE